MLYPAKVPPKVWATLHPGQRAMYEAGCPLPCLLPTSEKELEWRRANPPTVIPAFDLTPKNESLETQAFRAAEEERRRLKSLAQIAKMKTRFATKAVDFSKVRWDSRRNKFVPLEGQRPVTQSEPTVSLRKITTYEPNAGKPVSKTDLAGGPVYEPSITKENAEALAKLNSAWKPEYGKLRGTGRIVMTVKNVLRGKIKRGETVRWS